MATSQEAVTDQLLILRAKALILPPVKTASEML